MYSTKIISAFILLTLVLSFSATAVEEAPAPQISGKPADVQYPFIANVTGNNVYVRSGKGTTYYDCSKVNINDKVTVVEESLGWAKVVPPKGSYSWIHKDYVDVKGDSPTVGVLNGDNVRIWAGSDYIEPMRSSSMQTKLNTGEIVELLPDQPETADYYKIKSPAGAYLWINCQFLQYSGPVPLKKPTVIPMQPPALDKPDIPPSNETEIPTFKNLDEDKTAAETSAEKSPVKEPFEIGTIGESETLKQCYALATKIDQELQKPLNIQDYSDIRKMLETIKTSTDEDKTETYAQILLERIQNLELVINIANTLKEQDQALAEKKLQIEKAHQAKLKKLPKETGFIYAGVLKASHVYTQKTGQKRYLIQGPGGKILCYVISPSKDVTRQLEGLVGTKVGIQGTISNSQNSLVTLVSATAVQSLQ